SSRQPSVVSSCSGQGTPATEADRADGRHDGPAQSITALPARTGCPRRGNLRSLEARAATRESSHGLIGPTLEPGRSWGRAVARAVGLDSVVAALQVLRLPPKPLAVQ